MTYHIDIQNALTTKIAINKHEICGFATSALASQLEAAEITIRIVDVEEITQLNSTYRNQNKPTNVLAFPANIPDNIELEFPLLGDVIICHEILKEESIALHKTLKEHYALLVIHGVLHLLGFDHIDDNDAKVMQELEIRLLDELGFKNPYLEDDNEL